MTAQFRAPVPPTRIIGLLLGCLLACAAVPGCVQRRLTIRSNPPGALVSIDNYEIGRTPVSTSYIYYGKRQIRLVKDGCETLTVEQSIPAPWYEIFPLDFVSENLVPGEIRDERTLDFQLRPQFIVPTQPLLGRAENLRQSSRVDGLGQPPVTLPVRPPAANSVPFAPRSLPR